MRNTEIDNCELMIDDFKSSIINRQSSILVIGYGNPLRGDDGVGWMAVKQLEGLADPSRVRVQAVHQLTPELADPISKAELVIFIDAAADQPPGYLSSSVVKCPDRPGAGPMAHHLTPAGLLGLAQHVFGHAPDGLLFTVGGEDFSHKEGLSPAVKQACDRLVQHVMEII